MDPNKTERGITPNPDGRETSDQLLSDIRHTRGRMDHTLDELGHKLQPRHLFDEALDYFWASEDRAARKAKQTAGRAGRKIIEQVREHPLPSMMIGAGIIWMLSEQREKNRPPEEYLYEGATYKTSEYAEPPGEWQQKTAETSEHLKERAGEWKEKAGETKEQAAARYQQMKESASDKTRQAREKMGAAWESAKARTSAIQGTVQRQAQEYYHRSSDTVRKHPLALGLGVLAAGAIAGVLVPRTRAEDKMMGPVADKVRDEGKHQAQEIAAKSKEVASKVMEATREEAEKKGLTSEGLKETAQKLWETGKHEAEAKGLTPEGMKQASATPLKAGKEQAETKIQDLQT
jgi:ElaB/YqjD/DUF883 family membrane-anchored ribosome-binding protein